MKKLNLVDTLYIDEQAENGKETGKKSGKGAEKKKPKWTEICASAMRDHDVAPPLFSKLARGMDKKKVTFMIYARQWAELVAIKERYPERYKNDSDICRQFFQNAVELHIEMLKETPLERTIDDGLSDSLRAATDIIEKQYARQTKRKLVLEAIEMMYKGMMKGEVEVEELDETAKKLIGELPDDLKKISLQDFRRLKAGEKVYNILDFFEAHGG